MVRFDEETLEERYPLLSNQSRRNFPIVKSNFFVQRARHNLSVQEMKLLWSLIMTIKIEDEKIKPFKFSIKDFCSLCGIDENNGKNYINIKNTLINLSRKNFWLPVDTIGDREKLFFWIRDAEISKHSGIVEIELDQNLAPHLLCLKRDFMQYKFGYVMTMKSQYSIRLYELLKSYAFKRSVIFTLIEFRRLMNAEKIFKVWTDFRRKVLDKSIIEINYLTDINVSMKPIKTVRKVTEIRFNIFRKNYNELKISDKNILKRLNRYKTNDDLIRENDIDLFSKNNNSIDDLFDPFDIKNDRNNKNFDDFFK